MTEPMRVVSWNCQGGLARKLERLVALSPDIAVVSECANSVDAIGDLERIAWAGTDPTKGFAVFAKPDFGGSIDPSYEPTRHFFIPIRLKEVQFALLAVWAMDYRGVEGQPGYGRTHLALEHYAPFLATADLVVGDFNDNIRWDTPRRHHYATTAGLLTDAGFTNLHYRDGKEEPGAESFATFYLYRHLDKPYVLDHAFLRRDRLTDLVAFSIGDPSIWRQVSDHLPLTIDLQQRRNEAARHAPR